MRAAFREQPLRRGSRAAKNSGSGRRTEESRTSEVSFRIITAKTSALFCFFLTSVSLYYRMEAVSIPGRFILRAIAYEKGTETGIESQLSIMEQANSKTQAQRCLFSAREPFTDLSAFNICIQSFRIALRTIAA